MPLAVVKIALLLFGSGFCALIYQTVWLRELRLVFGASTSASAAVLAIFMGGLGLGSALLGKRADGRGRPLLFYANLELGVAASAALTPVLVDLTRGAYVALGGTLALGMTLGTVVRLALSALVLLVPTILMGGTLPAAAKAAESANDDARRHLSVLYACNTLGAVVGTGLSTFFLLEVFGIRTTLWMACLVNLLVALLARSLARDAAPAAPATAAPAPAPQHPTPAAAPPILVLAAAAVVGFAFLLMELVWYRMLGPLLGGSSYTFGLILALALLGIGAGGALYSAAGSRAQPTLRTFALTCTLEALFMAIPFALGDRLAVVSLLLADLRAMGFAGSVASWTLVASVVVVPASVVSGVQFPLLIALLGKGEKDVGRHVGLAYAYNTAGSIVGSLAGGFGLIPILTAPGCWRLVVGVLAALGVLSLVPAQGVRRWSRMVPSGLAAVAAVLLVLTDGPTAAWRHSGIGANRARLAEETVNGIKAFLTEQQRNIIWEEDGVESSVALAAGDGFAFVVNGKIDGHARGDAPTQVMGGMLGAALHPEPRRALVVGLGTGSTAGWLAAVDTMERVDVVELEPAILEVARRCAPVNRSVLDNPKVHVFLGDAREVLLTAPGTYDIIFSEPSNPYRAGVASLFTQEFYRAVATRLRPGGVFLQWVQGYEVGADTVRTIYATLHSVFPQVETWQTMTSDLMLVARQEETSVNATTLRARLEQEPFRSGLRDIWRVQGLEGLLSHHLARGSLAAEISRQEGDWLNTDDRAPVEFGFARSVGRNHGFRMHELMEIARERGEDRPAVIGEVDWALVEEERMGAAVMSGTESLAPTVPAGPGTPVARGMDLHAKGDMEGAAASFRAAGHPPRTLAAIAAAAEAYAHLADAAAEPLIAALRPLRPAEAEAILARLRWNQGRQEEGSLALVEALKGMHQDVWTPRAFHHRVMELVVTVIRGLLGPHPARAMELLTLMRTPFPLQAVDEQRRRIVVAVAAGVPGEDCVAALAPFEPYPLWTHLFLGHRAACYRNAHHPLAQRAEADLAELTSMEPVTLRDGFPAGGQPDAGNVREETSQHDDAGH